MPPPERSVAPRKVAAKAAATPPPPVTLPPPARGAGATTARRPRGEVARQARLLAIILITLLVTFFLGPDRGLPFLALAIAFWLGRLSERHLGRG
jgi:hypothetical protein